MNKTVRNAAALLLISTLPVFAGKKNPNGDNAPPPDTTSLVASVSPGSASGTGTVNINNSAAFSVVAGTTIILDGKAVTFAEIKAGQQVVSCTTAGSSAPEIDLKTPPPAPATKKKKKS